MSDDPPAGFRLFEYAMGFLDHVGPLFAKSWA